MSPLQQDEYNPELIIADDSDSCTTASMGHKNESSDSLSSQSSQKSVSFGRVEIREFNRIVGDHPDTRVGPPLSLGWEFDQQSPMPLDEYESQRSPKKQNLRMSSITRKNLLHNVFGIPEEEIRAAEKEVQKIAKLREVTSKQGKLSERTEEVVQAARRKFRRSLSAERLLRGLAQASMFMPSATAY